MNRSEKILKLVDNIIGRYDGSDGETGDSSPTLMDMQAVKEGLESARIAREIEKSDNFAESIQSFEGMPNKVMREINNENLSGAGSLNPSQAKIVFEREMRASQTDKPWFLNIEYPANTCKPVEATGNGYHAEADKYFPFESEDHPKLVSIEEMPEEFREPFKLIVEELRTHAEANFIWQLTLTLIVIDTASEQVLKCEVELVKDKVGEDNEADN